MKAVELQDISEKLTEAKNVFSEKMDGFFAQDRKLKIAILILVLLALVIGTYFLLTGTPSEKSIRVVDRLKKPLSGATLAIFSSNGSRIGEVITDQKGNARIDSALFSQAATLYIEKEGFLNVTLGTQGGGENVEIELIEIQPINGTEATSKENPSGSPLPTFSPEVSQSGPSAANVTPIPSTSPDPSARANPSSSPRSLVFGKPSPYEVCRGQELTLSRFQYRLVDLTRNAAAFAVLENGSTICAARTLPCTYAGNTTNRENEGLEQATRIRVVLASVNTTSGCTSIDVFTAS